MFGGGGVSRFNGMSTAALEHITMVRRVASGADAFQNSQEKEQLLYGTTRVFWNGEFVYIKIRQDSEKSLIFEPVVKRERG